MTNADAEKRIAELEKKLAILTQERQETANTWKPFGDFTRDNRMSRTRLRSLIARGKIEAEPIGRINLYRWAV